ncbi:MAG: ATP-binding protein [Candidatus Berkelbacteria bacterium]
MLIITIENFLADYWVNSVIVGFITLAGLILAYLVYQQNRKSVTNQTLAVFFVSITFWILFAHLGDSVSLARYSLLSNRIVYACLYFWAYCLILLPFVFPKDENKIKKPLRLALLALTLALASISIFTDKFISSVSLYLWGTNNELGAWGIFFNIYMSIAMIPALRYFWIFKRTEGEERRQLKYFLLGVAIFLVLILIVYLPVNYLVGDQRFYRYGNYSAIFLIGMTSYAIIKHHLFNVRVIATQLAVVLINIVSAVQVFSSKSWAEALLRLMFLGIIFGGSYLLVRSVKSEIAQKEELQKLSDQLTLANVKLKELDQIKDDFLSMASHELNTPISAIEGYLSMILDEGLGGVIPPKARTYLESVYKSSRRLANMVKDLLNVSRIESGRIHLIYSEVQIVDIIDQAVMEIAPKVKEMKHTLTFHKPTHAVPKTWFDATRITEILINMLGNSVKYTPAGGKIDIKVWTDDQKIITEVSDNGKGIPKESKDKVFEKFTQVDVLKDEVKGTGLGMYIAKKLIDLHKGKIWFESEGTGKGTSFFFSLPILKSKPTDAHEGEGPVLH